MMIEEVAEGLSLNKSHEDKETTITNSRGFNLTTSSSLILNQLR